VCHRLCQCDFYSKRTPACRARFSPQANCRMDIHVRRIAMQRRQESSCCISRVVRQWLTIWSDLGHECPSYSKRIARTISGANVRSTSPRCLSAHLGWSLVAAPPDSLIERQKYHALYRSLSAKRGNLNYELSTRSTGINPASAINCKGRASEEAIPADGLPRPANTPVIQFAAADQP